LSARKHQRPGGAITQTAWIPRFCYSRRLGGLAPSRAATGTGARERSGEIADIQLTAGVDCAQVTA